MQINYPQTKISTKTLTNDNQKILTKRQFMKMILNDQVKVSHKLEDQIIKKKIIKCFVHGSDRKFQTQKNKIQCSNTFQPYQTVNGFRQRRMSLNLQAPSVIGTKNLLFQKKQSNLITTYRDKFTFSRHSSRQKLKSCCNLRSSATSHGRHTAQKKQSFKIRPIHAGNYQNQKIPTIINLGIQQSPQQWQNKQFWRQKDYQKTWIKLKSFSNFVKE